jgi:hypothetical protein
MKNQGALKMSEEKKVNPLAEAEEVYCHLAGRVITAVCSECEYLGEMKGTEAICSFEWKEK